jgi:hypothetical protein
VLDYKATKAMSDKDHGTVLQSVAKSMQIANELLPTELKPSPRRIDVPSRLIIIHHDPRLWDHAREHVRISQPIHRRTRPSLVFPSP